MIRPGNPVPDVSDPQKQSERSPHGQPRPDAEDAPRQPSAAERARTLVEGNSSPALVIPGLTPAPATPLVPLRHSVGPTGDIFLLFPRDSPRSARCARRPVTRRRLCWKSLTWPRSRYGTGSAAGRGSPAG